MPNIRGVLEDIETALEEDQGLAAMPDALATETLRGETSHTTSISSKSRG